jgi:hypothetical protein
MLICFFVCFVVGFSDFNVGPRTKEKFTDHSARCLLLTAGCARLLGQ